MEPNERDHLEQLMALMAAGDRSAALPFADAFGGELAAAVRRHLRDLHRDDVARDRYEVHSLVIDVALLIADRAGSWSRGGALPWTWADRAIRSLVVAHVGHARADVDPEHLEREAGVAQPAGAGPSTGPSLDEFAVLADLDPTVGLLRAAIDEATTNGRDAAVHVEYRLQQCCGDPSPAVTVGEMFGLTPANVRQINRRVRARLRRLVDREPRYTPLRDLAWLDDPPSTGATRDPAPATSTEEVA